MRDEARKVLQAGPSNVTWFITAVVALSGEKSLLELDRDLKEYLKNPNIDPKEARKKARKIQDERNIPKAYEILYAILHEKRVYGGAVKEEEKEEEREKEETKALVVTDQNDYYALLGVSKDATPEEIEDAYKQRSTALQTEVLEKRLKAQGLSDSEIRTRIEQAQRDFEYMQEAYETLGDEEKRKYYDRFKENYKSGSQEQRSYHRETTPEEIKDFETLGLTPGASQIEIRNAYRTLAKKYHRDAYFREIGKHRLEDLTPEELKELHVREEKFKELQNAHERIFDQETLTQELAEKAKKDKEQKEKEQQVVIIETTPTAPKAEPTKQTEKFRKEVINQPGNVELSPEDTIHLASEEAIPNGTPSQQLSAGAEAATRLLGAGANANELSDRIDKVSEEKLLTQQQEGDLRLTTYILAAEEEANKELANALKAEAGMPKMSVTIQPATAIARQSTDKPNQITLQTGDSGFLQPVFDKGINISKERAGKFLTKGLEKTGVSGAKKFVTESLKKGASKVKNQILLKAGMSAAAGAFTGGGSFLAQAAVWIGSKLLKPLIRAAKKALSNILRFITGKDDLKSQLKELSGIAFIGSLAMGAVVPAIITGGIFFSALGPGSIIGGIGGVAAAVFIVVTSIILAVSIPILVSIATFVLLVIFITFIINNSAFVVPYGGIGVPPPGTIIPTEENQYIQVTKEASANDQEGSYLEFENGELPLTITYTITITSLGEELTDINASYSCYVQGPVPDQDCPDISAWNFPLTIPADGSSTFTYTQTFTDDDPDYRDSLVTDTVSVSAGVSGQHEQRASATAQVCFGDCPKGCPHLWPLEFGILTQGPEGEYSHEGQQAVDIGRFTQSIDGTPVYATHDGTVTYIDSTTGGIMIRISGNCDGIPFSSTYAHLGSRTVSNFSHVDSGQPIGTVDNSGTATTGTHLHYEFIGLPMAEPYIPERIEPVSDCCTNCEDPGEPPSTDCTTTIVNFR